MTVSPFYGTVVDLPDKGEVHVEGPTVILDNFACLLKPINKSISMVLQDAVNGPPGTILVTG